jgi:hypothetical protein
MDLGFRGRTEEGGKPEDGATGEGGLGTIYSRSWPCDQINTILYYQNPKSLFLIADYYRI